MVKRVRVEAEVTGVNDATNRRILEEMLTNWGMRPTLVASGQAALEEMRRAGAAGEDFSLVLLDAMMPQMDGFEATRTLKSRAAFAHIPVIFMTGLSDTDSVVRGFESGGVDYVTKPIRPAELVARLRAHLAGARLTRSAHQALDASGPPLMSVTAQGGINWVTPRGLELLGAVAHAPDWRLALAPMPPWLPGTQTGTATARIAWPHACCAGRMCCGPSKMKQPAGSPAARLLGSLCLRILLGPPGPNRSA